MQVSWSPIARCTSAAATDESTPPERPQITRDDADERADLRDLALDERARRPSRRCVADANRKFEMISPPRGVCATSGWNWTQWIGCSRCRIAAIGTLPLDAVIDVAGRRRVDVVAVAHPRRHALAGVEAIEQPVGSRRPGARAAVLAPAGADHLAARQVRDELHAVADAEHRREVEECRIGGRRAVLVDRVRAAAENDAGGLPVADPLDDARRRMDLRVDARLAHAPRDELRELRAVVDDEDA